MKKFARSILGVTLLEIMLVLAIAAMIIVMSVRYYQSATANQQANAILQMIETVTANADGLAQGTGSYSAAGVSTATLQPMMPNDSFTTPWGGSITVAATGSSTYTVDISVMPIAVCGQIKARLAGNPKYMGVTNNACTSVTDFTYTYDVQN